MVNVSDSLDYQRVHEMQKWQALSECFLSLNLRLPDISVLQAPPIVSAAERHRMRCAGDYTEAVAAAAAQHEDFVMGFISVSPSSWKSKVSPGLIQMTPGVQLTVTRPASPF